MVSNPEKPRVSAFIICCNEERDIRRALESVRWCDEILVIDSGSTDRTLDICREFTSKIIERPFEGFVRQKRFGLENCTCEWVLNIDSDEEVSVELRDEIIRTINLPDLRYDGFKILRVVFFLGKWWRKGGWHPEYRLRLVRRDRARWGGEDPHERAEVEGATPKLQGELRHYTYSSISDQIRTLNLHSSTAAQSLADRGEISNWTDIIIRPCVRFLKFFFTKKGFLEGFPGFIVACMESYYVFLKYIKLWEINHHRKA